MNDTTRKKNHWGWGWADRFPSEENRRGLGQMMEAITGFPASDILTPVPLADVQIPQGRMNAPEPLKEFISTETNARVVHAYGRSYPEIVDGLYGRFAPCPDLVATPRNEEEVLRILEWAESASLAVVPYGGGTSVVGGVKGSARSDRKPTVCLDMEKMGEIREVDDISRTARIAAGAFGPAIEERLRPQGWTLRHYPQSFEFSTLGGWIATRSAGHYASGPTRIDDFVETVRMVTPRGTLDTLAVPSSGAGPCPKHIALGSEGTLGIITEARMRLVGRPTFQQKATVRFDNFSEAIDALRALAQSGLRPSNCRLLDHREAMLHQVSFDQKNILLLGFESADHPVDFSMDRALKLMADFGGQSNPKRSKAQKESQSWKGAFFEAPYLQTALISLGVLVDTFETACRWDQFETLHETITREVQDAMQRVAGGGILSCRITHVYSDGLAPYYTFIAPGRPGSEIAQWQEIKAASLAAIRRSQATVTHHHAVGRIHRDDYCDEAGPVVGRVLAATKNALDPEAIMNPGILLRERELLS
jgi:alkyldihydroxyacetonephosphate synthase